MTQKYRPMGKRQFRIGELSTALGVERYVIRFWEKEFKLAAFRSEGGQRFYTSDDLATFHYIKDLLYNQGYTLAGARVQLEQQKHRPSASATTERESTLNTVIPARQKTLRKRSTLQNEQCNSCKDNERLQKDLETLSLKLQGLKKRLDPGQSSHS